jgi:hypothetical protein
MMTVQQDLLQRGSSTSIALTMKPLMHMEYLDPDCVIQGVHIILAFSFGCPEENLRVMIGQHEADSDWQIYYVNM